MTIEDFWNQAFLASLTRLSPECAKISADQALEICLKHWHSCVDKCVHSRIPKWQDQQVGDISIPREITKYYPAFTPEFTEEADTHSVSASQSDQQK